MDSLVYTNNDEMLFKFDLVDKIWLCAFTFVDLTALSMKQCSLKAFLGTVLIIRHEIHNFEYSYFETIQQN